MLIFLDTNIVQYCALYDDFLCGDTEACPVSEPQMRTELVALKWMIELEAIASWDFAVSPQLIAELRDGNPMT